MTAESLNLTASLEDYLEAICRIIAKKEAVRPKDIAQRLKVSNASVTGALHALAEKALINYAPYDVITLTASGKDVARDVIRRHEVLRDFFTKVLAVEYADADEAACRMEHSVPRVILERFIKFAEFVELCPRGGSKWIAGFGYQCDHGTTMENCEKCIAATLEEVKQRKLKDNKKPVMKATLKNLAPGGRGKVLKIKTAGETKKRLVEMGIVPGSIIETERIAPFGDPIDVKIKGYHLSLRKEEADGIEIEVLTP